MISGHSYLRILPGVMFLDTFGGPPPVLADPNGETYDNDYTCNITKVIYLHLTSVEYIHNLKFS